LRRSTERCRRDTWTPQRGCSRREPTDARLLQTERLRSALPPATPRWGRSSTAMRKIELTVLALILPVAYGCGSTCPETEGGRRMWDAVWHNDAKALGDLLDRGAAPANGDNCGHSLRAANRDAPLHIAAWHGNTEIMKVLLAHGASVDPLDVGAYTPLHLAASAGQDQAVAFLIAAGANVNARSKEEARTA